MDMAPNVPCIDVNIVPVGYGHREEGWSIVKKNIPPERQIHGQSEVMIDFVTASEGYAEVIRKLEDHEKRENIPVAESAWKHPGLDAA